MDFAEVLEKVLELLRRQGRVSYRALKLRFQLNDEVLEGIKEELLFVHAEHVKEEGPGLVWTEGTTVASSQLLVSSSPPLAPSLQHPDASRFTPYAPRAEGERRQLTVMFCDLVGSTALSEQLDPEEYREVVRTYQQTSAAVIERFDGYIAQYLGDGLLVYFGYPQAHEDDAARAVRAGLEIIEAIQRQVPSPLVGEGQGEGVEKVTGRSPLQVRIGIHTGPVVISEIGSTERHEQLALGETPNIAARVQGQAAPNTVVISATTYQLVQGLFE